MRSRAQLRLPGGVLQALQGINEVGHAHPWGALSMGCSEQRTGEWAPQLGADGPFSEGERHALSDKELEPVVDDAVKDGLGPGGRPSKLFQHHRRHSTIQRL